LLGAAGSAEANLAAASLPLYAPEFISDVKADPNECIAEEWELKG